MTQFDIIGTLRTFCASRNIAFIWHIDEYYANIAASTPYAAGQLILVVDLLPTPDVKNGKIADITYSGMVMLGRKFEVSGTVASLDETALQKYDRRLQALSADLVSLMNTFACDNTLQLTFGQLDYVFNLYDSNIDFVVSQNTTFVQ